MPKEWFEMWREPGEFYRAANKELGILTKLLREEGSKYSPPQYLRDAYYAGMFARIWRDDQGPCEVRLAPKDPPDAQLKAASGSDLNIEITVALPEGDRPLIEIAEVHRAQSPKPVTITDEEEYRERRRAAIAKAVMKKCAKSYPRTTTLLIVAGDASLSCEEMKRLTEPGKDCFSAIYLLCGMDVVRTWPELCVLRGEEGF
jgi:hypothetical protein